MTLRSVSLLVFFFLFFCLIFTSFFVRLFVYLFWRECDILLTNLTMENLRFFLFLVCSIFSLFYILFRLVFFFLFFCLIFTSFLVCLFVCLLVLTIVWYFTHKSHYGEVAIFFLFLVCSIFSFGEKKKAGLAWAYIVKRRILTVCIKIIKLSTVFPNIPFVESGR